MTETWLSDRVKQSFSDDLVLSHKGFTEKRGKEQLFYGSYTFGF